MYANTNLERLSLKYNNINSQGLCALFDALATGNNTLTHLFIWGNNLEESACIVNWVFYFKSEELLFN
jgi:hypothetical protein